MPLQHLFQVDTIKKLKVILGITSTIAIKTIQTIESMLLLTNISITI